MQLQLRAECRRFLDEILKEASDGQRHDKMNWYWEDFYTKLGALRLVFGQHIAMLSHLYKVDVEGSLVKILPPVVEQGETKKKALPRKS